MFLQTYIENIRGALEDNKEMNHHGKSVVISTVAPIEYVVSEENRLYYSKCSREASAIRSINEQVQRDALKKMYER